MAKVVLRLSYDLAFVMETVDAAKVMDALAAAPRVREVYGSPEHSHALIPGDHGYSPSIGVMRGAAMTVAEYKAFSDERDPARKAEKEAEAA